MTDATFIPNTSDLIASAEDAETLAVEACLKVRGLTNEVASISENKLRSVREAGARLEAVSRTRGGRPCKNRARALTSYQSALQRARLSRPTATVWRRVAQIPDAEFETFIAWATLAGQDLTIDGLLRACSPPAEKDPKRHQVTLVMSVEDVQAFEQYVHALGSPKDTRAETVLAVLARAYNAQLAEQMRSRSTAIANFPRVA